MTQAISVVLITLNAGTQLEACLKSVDFADEKLIVDSGSNDNTLQIARSHGAKVVEKEWMGFGPQKQFAVESARNDWVLCLDADERLGAELSAEIQKELTAPRAFAYEMPRCNKFMGRWLRHGEGYPDYCLRLFHRKHARWSEDSVHEVVVTQSPVIRLRSDLLHESAETLENYLDKQNRYTSLQANQRFAAGERANAFKLVFSPLLRFIKFYVVRLGFLDGLPGLIHI